MGVEGVFASSPTEKTKREYGDKQRRTERRRGGGRGGMLETGTWQVDEREYLSERIEGPPALCVFKPLFAPKGTKIHA